VGEAEIPLYSHIVLTTALPAPIVFSHSLSAKTMMDETDQLFDAVAVYFHVLSEPMRLKIMRSICQEEKSVNQIVEEVEGGQANVSRHLKLMFQHGVVAKRKEGTQVLYKVSDPTMVDICRSVCSMIAGRIDDSQPMRNQLLKLIPQQGKKVA
jgi:DNA-binding transcriptional ArsR family regulator